jgi:hypothetical protein
MTGRGSWVSRRVVFFSRTFIFVHFISWFFVIFLLVHQLLFSHNLQVHSPWLRELLSQQPGHLLGGALAGPQDVRFKLQLPVPHPKQVKYCLAEVNSVV